jgi:hypothetical protein
VGSLMLLDAALWIADWLEVEAQVSFLVDHVRGAGCGWSTQEGSPTSVCAPWCRAESGGGQDPADGACAHAVPEADEFSLRCPVASGGVVLCEAQHQGPDLVGDRWAA